MTRFLGKAGRFFWSWGFLKFVLWTVTLVVLFYVEEDWRGARAWAATKAKWEARGETFDYAKLVAPAVPADQNLAGLPLFRLEPDPESHPPGALAPVALQRALRAGETVMEYLPDGIMPGEIRGGWIRGKLPDFPQLRASVAMAYAAAFHRSASGLDALEEYEALCPVVGELQAAAAVKPYCQFEEGCSPQQPFNLSLITDQIALAHALEDHGLLALGAHRPDLTLQDIDLDLKVAEGLQAEPTLVAGLCAIAVRASSLILIYDGVNLHVWNDAQLAALQENLGRINALADAQRSLRGETCFSIRAFDQSKVRRPATYVSQLNARNQGDISKRKVISDMFPDLWADGWIDLMKVQAVNADLDAVWFVDPKARMVFPKRVEQFAAEIAQRQHGWSHGLWHILTDEAASPIIAMVQHFAQAQTCVDEARIACALERYRLAHGTYPPSLDAAAPYFARSMPRDIMSGQPYHYRLLSNGTFMLYSVGWNQKDDDGRVVYRKDEPRAIDYEQGDWAWAAPK